MGRAGAGLLVFAALSLSGCGGGGPAIEVSPDPVDFGEVVFPDRVTKEVAITNRSGGRLYLQTPRFGCACFSVVQVPAGVLEDGETTRLDVVLDSTKTDPRRFKKTMTVAFADAAGRPVSHTVDVVGEIVEYRRWSGSNIRLDAQGKGDLSVREGQGFRLTPKGASVTDPRLAVDLVPREQGGAELRVSVKEGARPGPVSAQVRANLVVEGRGKPARPFADSFYVVGEVQ